jgi:RNA-directed DNA polymerase
MPEDASLNGDAPGSRLVGPWTRVSEMQAKLHRWAVADVGRRFDDLFNFVYDPATLIVAFSRVAGNQGARTPGVDGWTVADIEEMVGVPGFLDDLRTALKDGSFRPLPVRERKIPKPGGSGKVRKLGIPTVADRVVAASGTLTPCESPKIDPLLILEGVESGGLGRDPASASRRGRAYQGDRSAAGDRS